MDRLEGWADKWGMKFNSKKCSVLNFGNNNSHFGYSLNGKWLESRETEKDLGVIVDNQLKFREQCIEVRNKANRILGFINKNVSYKSKYVIKSLYNSYVRPHIEYCIQAWKPYLRHDINMLESVQRRATKLIPEIRHKQYSERLKILDMFPIEYRLLRGDLIETYKLLHNIDKIDTVDFFRRRTDTRTRGHSFTLEKSLAHKDIRKFSFSYRVINDWNALPEHVVGSENLEVFKKRLDQHMIENYDFP